MSYQLHIVSPSQALICDRNRQSKIIADLQRENQMLRQHLLSNNSQISSVSSMPSHSSQLLETYNGCDVNSVNNTTNVNNLNTIVNNNVNQEPQSGNALHFDPSRATTTTGYSHVNYLSFVSPQQSLELQLIDRQRELRLLQIELQRSVNRGPHLQASQTEHRLSTTQNTLNFRSPYELNIMKSALNCQADA